MSNQLGALWPRIVSLAEAERGDRTCEAMFGDYQGISFNSYVNFASGKTWPRARILRHIERILGWKPGIIDEVLAIGVDPSALTLDHLRSHQRLAVKTAIQNFSNEEYFADMPHRIRELEHLVEESKRSHWALAASDSLGGVEPDQLEEH